MCIPVINLITNKKNIIMITKPMVERASQSREASNRTDLVTPATGHKDCVRDDKGFIVSVPGFISKWIIVAY